MFRFIISVQAHAGLLVQLVRYPIGLKLCETQNGQIFLSRRKSSLVARPRLGMDVMEATALGMVMPDRTCGAGLGALWAAPMRSPWCSAGGSCKPEAVASALHAPGFRVHAG